MRLDGGGSSDPDGTIANYEWIENGVSIGSGAAPLIALANGTHTIILQVIDNQGATDTDSVIITVNLPAPNSPPVANAGADHAVTDNDGNGTESVTLNGSGSSDSDGSIASYVWRDGATTVATGATASVSLSVGAHTLTLHVTDDDGASSSDTVLVTVNPKPNAPPLANAGADQAVTDNDGNGTESVTLNGSGSSDPNGNVVSYEWFEGATTLGSGATLIRPFSVGTHTLTLNVTDNDGATATDSVVVTEPVRSATAAQRPYR